MMLALNEIRRGRGRFASIIAALSPDRVPGADPGCAGRRAVLRCHRCRAVDQRHRVCFQPRREGFVDPVEHDPSRYGRSARIPEWPPGKWCRVLLTAGTAPSGVRRGRVRVQPDGAGVPTTLTDGRLPQPGENGTAAIDQELANEGGPSATASRWAPSPPRSSGWCATRRTSCSRPSGRLWTPGGRCAKRGPAGVHRVTDDVNAVAIITDSGVTAEQVQSEVGDPPCSARRRRAGDPRRRAAGSTLNSIIYTALAVAALVVALFFALVVLEKRERCRAQGFGTRPANSGRCRAAGDHRVGHRCGSSGAGVPWSGGHRAR